VATAVYGDGEGRVSVGRVISRAFGFIASSPGIALGSAVLFGALPSVLSQLVTFGSMGSGGSSSTALMAGFGVLQSLIMLVSLMFSGLMQATITRGLVIEHEGGRPSFGQCLAGGLRYAVPIVVFMVLWWIGIVVGMVFLIVPGLILLTMWSVAIPAMVEEGTGIFGAFGRSRELTRGSRWRIFGLLIMLLVLFYIVLAIIGILGFSATALTDLESSASAPPLMFLIGAALSGVVFNLLWSTIQPSLFVELRDAREGGGSGDLHRVFA
jgi:hypothetical protein